MLEARYGYAHSRNVDLWIWMELSEAGEIPRTVHGLESYSRSTTVDQDQTDVDMTKLLVNKLLLHAVYTWFVCIVSKPYLVSRGCPAPCRQGRLKALASWRTREHAPHAFCCWLSRFLSPPLPMAFESDCTCFQGSSCKRHQACPTSVTCLTTMAGRLSRLGNHLSKPSVILRSWVTLPIW